MQSPFDRDFLAHVRLNHLHVLFLLRLLLLNTLTEPDIPIIETASQMLALVVEIILLRDQLTNSGTGLIWKVCHFDRNVLGMLLKNQLTRLHTTVYPQRASFSSHSSSIISTPHRAFHMRELCET